MSSKNKLRLAWAIMGIILYSPYVVLIHKFIPDSNIFTYIGVIGSVTVILLLTTKLLKDGKEKEK